MEYLSVGMTLLVMAFSLAFLWFTTRKGKKVNLWYNGLFIFVLGAVIAVGSVVLRLLNQLTGQEKELYTNTGIAISLMGLIAALQGKIQQDPSKRWVVLAGAIFTLFLGIAFILIAL